MREVNLTLLFITHYPGMYGANQSMCRLMLELRNNYKITPVVLLPSRGDICEFLEQNNIKYFVSHYYWWVNEDKGLYKYLLNWRKQIINLSRTKKIVNLIDSERISLVYTNSITVNIGAFISKKLNCPHIWHLRESLEQFKFKLSLGQCISKLFLKNAANKYILISDYLTRAYSNLLPLHKTVRIYNGIDFSRVSGVSDKPTQFFNMCMLGIISEQKNNLDALKALNLLVHKYKYKNIRLHLIGSCKSDYLDLLNRFVVENKLSQFVMFYGHIKNIDDILKEMHLGLMCSRDEAFGRVTVEYMMHSMPVIASNSGANPEIVKEDVNGYIYSLYNEVELAAKINLLLNDKELYKKMGKTSCEYGKNNFSSERNTQLIYEVIQKLVNNK